MHIPFESSPEAGSPLEVAPGVHWLRLPLPFPPGHVNSWFVGGDDGGDLIDAGPDEPRTRAAMIAALEAIGSPPVRRVVGTHAHVDHVGAIGWLCETTGAHLVMPMVEWLLGHIARSTSDLDDMQRFHRSLGAPDEIVDALVANRRWFSAQFADFPRRFTSVRDGDVLELGRGAWRAMTGGGHAREQLALWNADEGVLIAADHLLETIEPIVPSTPFERDADPLADQFVMLDRFDRLPEHTLVLPSHGRPFVGIRGRTAAVRQSHRDRMERLVAVAADWSTCHDLLVRARGRPLPEGRGHHFLSEARSHLAHLVRHGRLDCVDDGECLRFRARPAIAAAVDFQHGRADFARAVDIGAPTTQSNHQGAATDRPSTPSDRRTT